MISKITEILTKKHNKTGGHCGMTLPQIKNEINCELPELRATLNQMYLDEEIEIRDGIHGRLIKIKLCTKK